MKTVKVLLAVLVFGAVCALPALAQAPAADGPTVYPTNWGVGIGKGFGAAITILGAGWGISVIGSRAVESMARQPEIAGSIQTAMIISAALIEGVSFFALIICLLISYT